ncbi:hypothetical protein [Lactococcus lactis]|uniref:hypothetical protein n=1 Tax=Lactococcus lactis TaxID=1358 RepID=UPI0024A6D3BA|nr:hypothetical protein [Lactococcus lactis]
MGTSSSYKGPNGKNPLLPDDFGDGWADLKSEMSQFLTGSRKNSSKRILSKYVKANGGAQALSQRSKSGISTLGGFIGFLNNAQSFGVVDSFRQLNIEFDSESPSSAFSQLVNKLGAAGDFKEDIAAREALLFASSKLYGLMEEQDIAFDAPLSELSEDFLLEGVKIYSSELIVAMVLNDLGASFEKYGDNTDLVIQQENEIRDYVRASVDVTLNVVGLSGNPEEMAQKIITSCYEIFVEE